MKIFSLKGKLVETLINEHQLVGDYSVVWSPENISSGIYLCQLTVKIN